MDSANIATLSVPHAYPIETSVRLESRPGFYAAYLKRVIDVTLAATALILLSPLMFILCVLIRRCDGGPIFFRQKRCGKDGQVFDMLKFRSMTTNADAHKAALAMMNHHGLEGITFKIKDDPRTTPIGRFLRRTSLDELPQLINIIKGEMSLVGPRPAVPSEIQRYNDHHRTRLAVTPGLTCHWQVKGRSDLPFDVQVELDRKYIAEMSLLTDLKLLILTIPAVISGRGAY